MVLPGWRCGVFKDGSIDRMTTGFVGMPYKSVDLSAEDTVAVTV